MENQNQKANELTVGDDGKGNVSPSLAVAPTQSDYDPDSLSFNSNVVQPLSVSDNSPLPEKRPSLLGIVTRRANVILVVLLILGMGGVLFAGLTKGPQSNKASVNDVSSNYKTQEFPLGGLEVSDKGLELRTLGVVINGTLTANNGVVITPSLQPSAPKTGQIYYDQGTNQLGYFNGSGFVLLGAKNTDVVENLGGLTGQVGLGGGLAAVNNQLINAGVLSLGGSTGTIVLGNGLNLSDNVLQNTGILNITAGTPNVTITDNGAGSVSVSVTGSGTGTVTSGGGTAGTIPLFTTSQNIEDSLLSQSGGNIAVGGTLSVTGALALGSALSVPNGGTGATSLAANGVIVGNGAGALSSVTAGGAGLCLVSTAGAPTWGSCAGGGVTSLNGLTGALSIANASVGGSTITINDATTAAKGIASFNSTNFTVGSGAVNTVQNINSAATPTFAGVNTNNITPSAALTVGISAQTALLQGSTTTITSSGAGNDIILNSADTIELQDNTNITGNLDVSGTLTSGTANAFQVDASGNVTSGDVAANGGDITSAGALNITPGGALTAGVSGQTLTLQGNASTSLRATNGANTTIVAFTSPTANTTLNFPALSAGTYTICTTSGNCAGAGVTLQAAYDNSSTPEIVLDATRGALTIRDASTPIGANLLEVQNNAGGTTYLAVTSSGLTVTGTATITGNINSSGGALQTAGTTRVDNSGNLANIGSLSLSGSISGGTTIAASGNINTTTGVIQTNSTTRIDNSGNLTNIAAITASGSATLQGGGLTLGTNAQAGSVVINDGSSNTGTLQVAALGQNTVYTLPDPGVGTATICLSSGNCSGVGGGVTTAGGTTNTVPKFTGSQTIGDSIITDNGSTVTIGGTLAVNTISPTGAFTAGVNGQTSTVQGSITTITSSGAGNDIILNSADTIELQDNTNITGNLDVSGTLASGTGNAFQVDASGNVTGGTYNTNTFNATNLQFGAAATATVQSAGSQALTITGNAASTWSTSSGNLTVQAASSLNLKATSGNVVLGTSDTTGTLLVLDIKTDAIDPTGTDGAIYYNSNLASFRCYQGGAWTNCITASGGFVSLQNAYDNGNTISTDASGDIAFTLNNQNFTIANAAGATGSTTFSLADGSNATPASQLVLITNDDVNEAVANGLTIGAAAGGITDGLDVSDSDIVNAINVGDNTILGTAAVIDFTSFDVSSAGAITSASNATLQGGSVTLGTTSQAGSLIINDGSSNTGAVQTAALGQNTVYTLPDPGIGTVTICLTTGNCAGSGGGVTGSGTNNRITKFTSTGSTVGDSTITDNGTTVTTSADLVVQGGDATIGVSSTQTGTLNFADSGSAFLGSIVQATLGANRTYTLPDSSGDFCLSSGNCLGGSGGGANTALSNLASVNINAALNATSANLNLTTTTSGNIVLNSAGTIELQDNTNVTGTLGVSSTLTVTAGGAGIAGNTTIATTAGNTLGLGNSTGALTVTGSSSSTFVINGSTIDATEFNRLDGKDAALVDTNDAVNTAITGTGVLGAGSIASGFGAIDTGADNITTTGTLQGTTSVLTQSLDRTTAGALNIGASTATSIVLGQNTSLTGAATFASGTGTVLLQGNTDIANTVSLATRRGATYTTPGSANDVAISTASLYLLDTSGTAQTITGIVAGRDGQYLTLVNADAALAVTLANNAGGSAAANRITTGTGTDISIPVGGSISLIYDSASSLWRVTSGVAGGDGTCSTCANTALSNLSGVNINTALNATSSNLNLTTTTSGNIVLNSAGTIELQDNTNVTGTLGVSSILTVSAGGANIAGNTTIATTAGNTLGLGNGTGALTVTGSSSSTFVINGVTVDATEFNRLDGKDAALVDTNDAVNTAITGTGALNSGSITSGFGAIDTGADNITTTGAIQGGTGTFTGANAVTVGITGTNTGAVLFQGSTAASGTLTLIGQANPTNNTITLPNATGTVCLQNSASCGFATGSGSAFVQGGNSFTAAADLGTNDAFDLNLRRGGTTKATVGANNLTLATNIDLLLQGATAYISNSQTQSNSEAFGLSASVAGDNSVSVGASASTGFDGVAIGSSATATGAGSIAIGKGANAGSNTDVILIGADSTATASHQVVIGGSTGTTSYINDIYLGAGVTDGGASTTLGTVAINATGGSGLNNAGANLNISGGKGTGSANGGGLNFQIAKPGTSGSGLNSLGTVFSLSGNDGSALFKNATDSSTAFRIQNAGGTTTALSVDTTGGTAVTIGSLGTGAVYATSGVLASETNLAVTRGGTGAGTFASNGVLYGNGTGAIQATAAGANGQCLVGNTGAAPSWTTCTGLVTLQNAYANGNTISTTGNDIAFTLNSSQSFTVATAAANTAGGVSFTSGNTSGTQTNGLLIDRNGASGMTTNGININQTAGTLTNGLAFTGTIGTDINRASGTLTLQGGGGVSIKTANGASTTGSITIKSGDSSGASAGTVIIDSGTWSGASLGWVAIGATNANLVNLGNATSGTVLSLEAGTAAAALQIGNGNTAHGIQIGTGTAAQTIVLGSMNTTSSTTIQGGSNNITLQTNGASTIVKSNTTNSTSAFQVQNSSAAAIFNVDTTNQRAGVNTSAPGSTFQVNQSSLAPGTVSNSASSASVTGSSTTFFSTFQRGDTFTITSSGNICTVLSITSDTALTCTVALAGSSSGSTYSFTQQARATVRDNGTTSLNGTVIISSPTANNQFTFRNDTSDNTLKIGSSIIGNASNDGSNDSNANFIQATKFNSGPGGTISSLRVFFPVVDGANPHFKVAVYSDSAGSPNSLLSSATATSTTATAGQWNTAPLDTTVTLTPNTDYWLATSQESGSTEFRIQSIGTNTTKYQSGFTYTNNFPATYTVNSTTGDIMSIYAPYISITDQSNVTGAIKISENNEVSVRPIYNSDTALEVLKADGTQIFNVNTFAGWTGVEQLMVGSVDTSYNAFIAGNNTNGALGVDRGSSTATDSIMELFSSVGGAGTLQMKVTADGTLQLAGGGTKNITTSSAASATAIGIQPGNTTANNGTGAAVNITGGDTTTGTCGTSCTAGNVNIQGGAATTNPSGTRNGGSIFIDAGSGSTSNGSINIGTLTSADMTIGKTTGSNSLLLQAGQNVTLLNNNSSGTIAIRTATNSSNGIQLQDSASAALLTADTSARSGSGGNLIKIGNSTGTDTATTILKLDGATADPTTNLAALNGGLFYNSTTNKVSLIENGAVKIICNTTDLGCGTGTVTLQSAYNNSTNPEITLGAAATAGITIRNNATPISGNLFEIQNNGGTSTFLSTTTTGVGINIGSSSPSADLTFGDGADRIINVLTRTTNAAGNSITLKGGNGGSGASANAGGNVTIQGGDAAGTGAADGGNIVLQPGIKNGGGEGGQIVFNNTGGRADFFIIKSSTGEELLHLYDPSSSGHYNNYLFLGGPCCNLGTPYRITMSEQGSENYVDIGVDDSTAQDGKSFIIHGGSTSFTNGNGGSVILTAGNKNGTGTAGSVIVRNTADAANAFRIQNAAGTSDFMTVNTSTGATVLGTTTQTGQITVGQSTASQTIAVGSGTTAAGNTLTVNVATSATSTGKAVVTIGNTNDGSSLLLQAGTGNITAKVGASTSAFQVQNTSAVSLLNINTQTAANEVVNGDFERGNTNGWSLRGSAANLATSSTQFQFGKFSLNFDTVSANGNGVQYSVAFKPSTTYSLSIWARRSATSAASFNIGRADNGSDTDCLTNQTFNTTYTQFTCSFTTGATIGTSANIYVKQTDTTTDNVFIDGVSLYPLASAVTYTTPASGLQVDSLYSTTTINAANNAELQPWLINSNSLPEVRSRPGVTTYNGYMYVVGGGTAADGGTVDATGNVIYGKINADGSVGSFTTTTNLGTAVSATDVVAMNGYLYVLGGSTTGGFAGAIATVQYAKINNDGTVGTWATATAPLTAARSSAAITSYNGYIYVIGGFNTGGSGQITSYYAKANANGDITAWSSGTSLAAGSYTNSAIVANGYMYVVAIGGGDQTRVDYAKVNADGSLGSYTQTTSLPVSKGDFGIGVMNGNVYVLGGYSGASIVNTIYYASTKSDGSLTPWLTSVNPLAAGRENLKTVTANGYLYVVGGDITGGTVQSSVLYTSGARLRVAGALDLVGLTGQNLNEGASGGGQLTAGNTNIVGTLNVQENAIIMRNFTANGNANFQNSSDSISAFAVLNATSVPQFNIDTTNSRVYIGNPTADSTGALLVLDTKNTSGDPTGVLGAMYFNSSLGKMRCFETDQGTAGYWRDCVESARTAYRYTNEMMTTQADQVVLLYTSNAGSFANVTGVARHPGINELRTGTNTNGGAGIGSNDPGAAYLLGNNDYWRFESVLNIPTLSDGTNTFTVRAGFSDNGVADAVDGCYFRYSSATNSGKWQGVCRNNSTESTCDTGITVAATTWYRLTFAVNTAGNSVDFQTDGTSRCQVTTNIPTSAGRETSWNITIQKSASTTSRTVQLDYVEVYDQFGASR